MARLTKAAQERAEMDMARDARGRARELHSLATMTRDRATAMHLGSNGKLNEFKAERCTQNTFWR